MWGARYGAWARSPFLSGHPCPRSREPAVLAPDVLALRARCASACHWPPCPLCPPQDPHPQGFTRSSTIGWCGSPEDRELPSLPPPTPSVPGDSTARGARCPGPETHSLLRRQPTGRQARAGPVLTFVSLPCLSPPGSRARACAGPAGGVVAHSPSASRSPRPGGPGPQASASWGSRGWTPCAQRLRSPYT